MASSLQGLAASVRVVHLPELPDKGDVSDWLAAGGTADELARLADAAMEWTPTVAGGSMTPACSAATQPRRGDSDKKSQATLLVELAGAAELWHTAGQGDAWTTIEADGHREHWPVRSRAFRRWLSRRFFEKHGKAPGGQALQDAIAVIEGQALFEGPEHTTWMRVAEHDGRIFLDLADAAWRAVEITSAGWRVVDDCPVRFRRAKAMQPLREPQAGGDIAELRRFVNVTDDDWPLVLGWLVAAMRPTGPYPILALHGEQGAAKTTTARVLRAIVDANAAPVRCEPRDARDLAIAANNGWVVALDNLSHVPPWLSDALCRLSTGGGFSTRTLYENDEETIFEATRPVMLTGIEEVATRGDLLDRCLLVHLPSIPERQRLPEAELWRAVEEARPRLLGALLDAVTVALRELPTTRLERLPRMADFALWACAAERGMGLQPGEFIARYSENRAAANETALEGSPVAAYIVELARAGDWEGKSSDLLDELEAMVATESQRKARQWPKSPKGLTGQLKRIAPHLRAMGIYVEFRRAGRGRDNRRTIAIRSQPQTSDPNGPSDPTRENPQSSGVTSGSDPENGVTSGRDLVTSGSDAARDVTPCRATMGSDVVDGVTCLQPLSNDATDWIEI